MLRPQESRIVGQRSSEYEAKLWIELSKAYPFKIPDKLAIEASPKVMSNQTRAQLQASLIKLAERKADEGEVYLYDLCDLTKLNLYRIKMDQPVVDAIKEQFVEPITPPPPSKSATINRRMSRVTLMAAQSIPTIQATVQAKSRTSHLSLLDCELLSSDSHLDALGFEQRLLVDQTCGDIYTGLCATFMPRSLLGLADNCKKLHKFIESVHERLRNAEGALRVPHAFSIETDVDIRHGKYSYLGDYYDESQVSDEILAKSVRLYVIYRGLLNTHPPRPTSYNQLRLLASQLLDALQFLSRARIGHGHLSLGHIAQGKDGSLAVSGAGLLQVVHKANDLGFAIIGNGEEFNTFQSNDLVNLGACLKELSRTVDDTGDMTTMEHFVQECSQRQVPNAFNIAFLRESKFISRRQVNADDEEGDSDCNSASIATSTDEGDVFKQQHLASFTKETNTFNVIELIGSGGFGVVVKVINRNIK